MCCDCLSNQKNTLFTINQANNLTFKTKFSFQKISTECINYVIHLC